MSIRDQIGAVLKAHPLKPGDGWYKNQIICGGCHLALGFPEQHLLDALCEALDPVERRPAPVRSEASRDPRESYVDWRTA